ncbi:cation channel sperm-associated protein subunit delta-like [Hypomesus transpacificus]|uniref:cation channel sperm-associated protein subunit delta-like n=1 Tax=Hypomesus transpacificus TaxID=137520 RepID=UPI001F078BDA|nr:cation channel sperm-associated protein subunit delta-like [Hypomesus transpacificus]
MICTAAFVLDSLAIVIDEKLYIYSLEDQTWTSSQGVDTPVDTISTHQCCFSKEGSCLEVSSVVLLYSLGSRLDLGRIYMSTNGGLSFQKYSVPHHSNELIGGLFNMPTVSSIVEMIIDEHNMFSLRYTAGSSSQESEHHPLMDPPSTLNVIQTAGMRGHLIIWSPNMLLYSPNHGIVLQTVAVINQGQDLLPPENVTVIQVATDNTAVIAVMTSDGALYYGRMGMEAKVMKMTMLLDLTQVDVMLFTHYGDLLLIKVYEDLVHGLVDFDHKTVFIQQELARISLLIQGCQVEEFDSTFQGEHFYIDMDGTLELSAVYVPSPVCTFFPLVTVTNSQLLSTKVVFVLDGITRRGTKKYRMDIKLRELGYTNLGSGSQGGSSRASGLSTVAVELMGRYVSCNNLNPLKAHIINGCPPGKHIRVLKKVTTCTKDIISQETLQDNFTYLIPKEVYDPEFLARPGKALRDLILPYSVVDYVCPLLVFKGTPWIPSLQLWQGETFVEDVKADFILFEVHGMHNYEYTQTVRGAECVSQPQNWTAQLSQQHQPDPHTAWNRQNYVSCLDSDGPPLSEPTAQYQVLNKDSGNRVLFPEYNGMYIFKAIVVDPRYSYCQLTTTFSVFVYGAFPHHVLPSGLGLGIFLGIFVALLMAGFFFKLRSSKA